MNRPIDSLFPPKSEARDRFYIWDFVNPSPEYAGQVKIGRTIREDVNERILESQGQARQQYTVHAFEPAEREDGSSFSDKELYGFLERNGIERVNHHGSNEWFRCTPGEAKRALAAVRAGVQEISTHHKTFCPRAEQKQAVEQTLAHFTEVWRDDPNRAPRFLWNAKMRFGKTFTAYQLAMRMEAKRILVLTFKPAVADAWRTDLLSHRDFIGWQYRDKNTGFDERGYNSKLPLVYFGSFQDLLGKDRVTGNIKPRNEWIHTLNWDLVIFDEYHYGAWRENAQELFEGEDSKVQKKELAEEYDKFSETFDEQLDELSGKESDFLPITTRAYLYLSGTPFRALRTAEFVEDQIFNWTYTDEQKAKRAYAKDHPGEPNPYGALPEMRLFTYKMPDELVAVAHQGELDEFDLNEFFAATGSGNTAEFKHKSEVQKWLTLIRGGNHIFDTDSRSAGGGNPPLPYSDVRLLPYLNHSFWYLPNVAACEAMANLMSEPQNTFWHKYDVLVIAGSNVGVGLAALEPVRRAVKDDTKTITLSCGKLTTGVTVKQWSSILMLRNLKSPESYFQAAFRVQSPWKISNPEGTDPGAELVKKEACFVFDFAPNRALRQLAEYGTKLSADQSRPDQAVQELINFFPVLAYDGLRMQPLDADEVLQYAMSGTTGALLAKKWESALLVNVDNDTLSRIIGDPGALDAVMKIEGFRALGKDVFETIINKSEAVKKTKQEAGDDLSPKEKKQLTAEENEYKSKRKKIQEKLIKFATRIPAFMYLTDYREDTLQDVITKLEPVLFKTVTGLDVADFELLVSLNVFNSSQMNDAIIAFRRFENSSLNYTGIASHKDQKVIGAFDTAASITAVTG